MLTEFQMFWQAAQRQPQATALAGEGISFTYAGLLHEAEVVAAGLAEAGVRPGAIVGTVLPNSNEHVLALLALARLGAVPAPISPRLKPAQAGQLVREAQMSAAIVGADAGLLAAVAEALGPGARLISTGAASHGCVPFSACRGEPSRLPGIPQPGPSDPAVIFYTSGTTGLPKGVVVPHRAAGARHLPALLPLTFGDRNRFEGHMPLCHPVGYHMILIGALTTGGTYHLVQAFDPAGLAALVAARGITLLGGSPAQWHALLEAPGFSAEALASLDHAWYGGAPMSPSLLERVVAALPCPLYNVYGVTELGNVGFLRHTGHKPGALRPTGYYTLRAVRPGGQPEDTVPAGEIGELIASAGPGTAFSGYLNRPGATAAALTGGWYRTGDLARFDADGDFWLAGRADDMIISGASNIYPEEVEAVLAACPGIADVAVVGVPDDRYGELVVACAAGSAISAADLDAHCRASDLADYKRPQAYLFLPELPRNSLAKILRSDLRQAAAEAHRSARLGYINPASPPPGNHPRPRPPAVGCAMTYPAATARDAG
jgi:2-furoate---CoA ligase